MIEIQKDAEGKVVAFHSVLHQSFRSNSYQDVFTNQGKELLSTITKLFEDANVSIETRLISDIYPEDYIKETVEKENFNLVVLGNRGKHRVKRSLGSIPTKVMNNVVCDVLIVR